MPNPTSDPDTWVRVAPNTVMASAAALRLAAVRFENSGFPDDGDACADLAGRLERALKRWEDQT